MTNLSGAVAKTMNFVFADIESPSTEIKKRINSLKANIGKIVTVPLTEIETGENVRKSIDTSSESFLRLVESIKRYGVLENIVVELRLNKKETDYKLVCIAGHRRILAALAAQTITKVPCLLQSFAKKGDNVGAALAENLNREDLHCLDVAEGYKELLEANWSEDDLAQHFCRDVRTIRHYLKMAAWNNEIKTILRNNESIFSTRVIMREFAYKKFNSASELKSAINSYLVPGKKKVTKIAKKTEVNDKKKIKASLQSYLQQQKLLSGVIKDEIKKAFIALNLI